MSRYRIQDYVRQLDSSLKFMKYYRKRYNNDINNVNIKYKFDYHIFSFSQIAYALKEVLNYYFPSDKRKIERKFKLIRELANEWKHPDYLKRNKSIQQDAGFFLRQNFIIEATINGVSQMSVEKMLPQGHYSKMDTLAVNEIFENFLIEIKKFCASNGYV